MALPAAIVRQVHIHLHTAIDEMKQLHRWRFVVSGIPGEDHIYR